MVGRYFKAGVGRAQAHWDAGVNMRGVGTLISWALFYAGMAFMLSHFLVEDRKRLDPPAPAQSLDPTLEAGEPVRQSHQNAPEIPQRMPCHYGKSIYTQDCAGALQQPRKIKPLKMAPPEAN